LCRESRFFRLKTAQKRRSDPFSASNQAPTRQPPLARLGRRLFARGETFLRKSSTRKHIREYSDVPLGSPQQRVRDFSVFSAV
jgi:hypothetical protein